MDSGHAKRRRLTSLLRNRNIQPGVHHVAPKPGPSQDFLEMNRITLFASRFWQGVRALFSKAFSPTQTRWQESPGPAE